MPTRDARWIGVALVAFGLLLAGLVLEGAVRVLSLAPPLVDFGDNVADPHLPFRPRPLSRHIGQPAAKEFTWDHQHNSQGFRDVEHALDKPAGVFRILGLGDSFTYGVGVTLPDTYLSRLEVMLNLRSAGAPPVEIIKAGIYRFYPETERLLLQHYGGRFQPDLILVGFLPNDIIDTYYGLDSVRIDADGRLRTPAGERLGRLGGWLYRHSAAARIVLTRYAGFMMSRDKPTRWLDVYKPEGFHEADWRKAEAEFASMVGLARGLKAKMAIIHIPQKGPWDASASYPATRLARLAAQQGVAFIDMLPAMKAAAEREVLYWAKDGHTNSAGHRVIAETVYAALIEKELVPAAGARR